MSKHFRALKLPHPKKKKREGGVTTNKKDTSSKKKGKKITKKKPKKKLKYLIQKDTIHIPNQLMTNLRKKSRKRQRERQEGRKKTSDHCINQMSDEHEPGTHRSRFYSNPY